MTIHNTEASGLEGELAPTESLQPGSVSATATLSCSVTGETESKRKALQLHQGTGYLPAKRVRGDLASVGTKEGLARTTAGFHVCHPNSERGGLDSKPAPFLWAPRICFLKHGCVRLGDLYGLQQTAFIRFCCCLVSRATAVSPHALCHVLCGRIPARSPSLYHSFLLTVHQSGDSRLYSCRRAPWVLESPASTPRTACGPRKQQGTTQTGCLLQSVV